MNYFSPINSQFFDANGNPLNAGKVYTYLAGTSTPATTYTTQGGTTPQSNPITLDSLGYMPNPLWLATGVSYKLIIQDSSGSTLKTFDNIGGVNDVTTPLSQWVTFTGTATYISSTQFSVTGDQTAIFSTGRRLQTTNSGGTIYSTITTGVYSAGITTVTVVSDAGGLDSGLSVVLYGVLTYVNSAMPKAQSALNADNVTGTILSAVTATTQSAGDNSTKVATTAFVNTAIPIMRSYLSGLGLTYATTSTTIAAGQCADSTNAVLMTLSSSIQKTRSAWAVGSGSGGLDTGTYSTNTWYYWYIIRRPDTGVVDAIFSLSSSAPTLPTNYTQYRYIGATYMGASVWTPFKQTGDHFYWASPVLDYSSAGSTTAALLTCSVPSGRKMKAFFNFGGTSSGTAGIGTYVSDPDLTDLAPSTSVSPLMSAFMTADPGAEAIGVQIDCWTNTSGQVRHREFNTGVIYLATLGWMDSRGKDL